MSFTIGPLSLHAAMTSARDGTEDCFMMPGRDRVNPRAGVERERRSMKEIDERRLRRLISHNTLTIFGVVSGAQLYA